MAADSMALEMEFRVFEQHKKEWLQAHPGEFEMPSVKLSSTPAGLLQQGPLIDILISATRFELDEGRGRA